MGTQSGKFESALNSEILSKDPRHGQVHQDIIDAINRLALNSGHSPTGDISAPKPPDAVSVKVAGEFMHVSISHGGPIDRGIRYFSEISTSPTFSQPIVVDHGSSRTSHPFPLPAKNDNGDAHSFYVRSYAQYPGSPPSAPTVVGGVGNPTAFTMTGTTHMTLLPSTGSGTAPNTGQSAAQGLGRFQRRQT